MYIIIRQKTNIYFINLAENSTFLKFRQLLICIQVYYILSYDSIKDIKCKCTFTKNMLSLLLFFVRSIINLI